MRNLGLLLLVFLMGVPAVAGYVDLGTGGGLPGVTVSSTPPSTNQCLVATSSTAAAWGSCSSGSGISGTWGATTGNVVTTNGASAAQDSGTAFSSVVTLSGSQTLTNKTLTSPIVSGLTGLIEALTGFIETPTDKTYVLDQSAAYAYTINTLIIATVSGTTTAAVKIGGTNVTGISAVSVSSTPATGTASAANSVSVGNKVTLVLSSSSSPVDMSWTLKVTR